MHPQRNYLKRNKHGVCKCSCHHIWRIIQKNSCVWNHSLTHSFTIIYNIGSYLVVMTLKIGSQHKPQISKNVYFFTKYLQKCFIVFYRIIHIHQNMRKNSKLRCLNRKTGLLFFIDLLSTYRMFETALQCFIS